MNAACHAFHAALERALGTTTARLAALAGDEHLASCVPCRRELERELRLERLLDRAEQPSSPPGLEARLLSRLKNGDEPSLAGWNELDDLLARVPEPRTPAGLAERVLAGVAVERAPRRSRGGLWALAAAGIALVFFFLWRAGNAPGVELARQAGMNEDEDLLIYAVENWELLHDDDLDVWLASLAPEDELLVEIAEGEEWPEDPVPNEDGR
jgi:hypothetical protein